MLLPCAEDLDCAGVLLCYTATTTQDNGTCACPSRSRAVDFAANGSCGALNAAGVFDAALLVSLAVGFSALAWVALKDMRALGWWWFPHLRLGSSHPSNNNNNNSGGNNAAANASAAAVASGASSTFSMSSRTRVVTATTMSSCLASAAAIVWVSTDVACRDFVAYSTPTIVYDKYKTCPFSVASTVFFMFTLSLGLITLLNVAMDWALLIRSGTVVSEYRFRLFVRCIRVYQFVFFVGLLGLLISFRGDIFFLWAAVCALFLLVLFSYPGERLLRLLLRAQELRRDGPLYPPTPRGVGHGPAGVATSRNGAAAGGAAAGEGGGGAAFREDLLVSMTPTLPTTPSEAAEGDVVGEDDDAATSPARTMGGPVVFAEDEPSVTSAAARVRPMHSFAAASGSVAATAGEGARGGGFFSCAWLWRGVGASAPRHNGRRGQRRRPKKSVKEERAEALADMMRRIRWTSRTVAVLLLMLVITVVASVVAPPTRVSPTLPPAQWGWNRPMVWLQRVTIVLVFLVDLVVLHYVHAGNLAHIAALRRRDEEQRRKMGDAAAAAGGGAAAAAAAAAAPVEAINANPRNATSRGVRMGGAAAHASTAMTLTGADHSDTSIANADGNTFVARSLVSVESVPLASDDSPPAAPRAQPVILVRDDDDDDDGTNDASFSAPTHPRAPDSVVMPSPSPSASQATLQL